MAFGYEEATFVGCLLTNLVFGSYLTVFCLYIKIMITKKEAKNLVEYGIIALFVLVVAFICIDNYQHFYTLMRGGVHSWTAKTNSARSVVSLTIDFVTQILLIYRCWIVWGKRKWVAAVPGFLSIAFYATGLTLTIDMASQVESPKVFARDWWTAIGATSMTLSLTVNAVVSTIMISRIWLVHRQSKQANMMVATGTRLSWIAAILLESAIALFFAQLIFLIQYQDKVRPGFSIVMGPVTIIYALNCTAIMVRVGMNRSYETMATSNTNTTIVFGMTRGELSTTNPSRSGTDGSTEVSFASRTDNEKSRADSKDQKGNSSVETVMV